MNQLFKLKFKMHKFVNIIFYLIIFIIGFLIGLGVKKISFNNVLSKVLMIDNVEAYTLNTEIRTYNEEFIVNEFNKLSGFDINEFPYIMALIKYGGRDYELYAFDEIAYDCFMNKTIKSSGTGFDTTRYSYQLTDSSGSCGRRASVYYSSGSYNSAFTNIINYGYSTYYVYPYQWRSAYKDYYFITNFDLAEGYGSQWDVNRLDFSSYITPNLEFNENLFKDNPNFKEVCVPNNKDFAISTNNYEINENESSEYYGSKSFSSYGFIWFPYYVNRLESYLYDNSKTDNIWIPEEDETYFDLHPIFHYWLDSKEEIDRVWSLEDPGSFLNSLGYTDKYSYFGWYTHPFVVRYANSGLRQFSIFRFSDDVEFYSTLENGLDYFEKLENARNGNVCFYIRKDFDVTLLNTDEFGDKYGDIIIMGDEKLEVSTTQNISNIDSKGLFHKVKLFLNKMTKPIKFVKDYIFELYDSMPYLLKLFIISVFGLIVIKILIEMVVR